MSVLTEDALVIRCGGCAYKEMCLPQTLELDEFNLKHSQYGNVM